MTSELWDRGPLILQARVDQNQWTHLSRLVLAQLGEHGDLEAKSFERGHPVEAAKKASIRQRLVSVLAAANKRQCRP